MGARIMVVITSDKLQKGMGIYSHWGAYHKSEMGQLLLDMSREHALDDRFGGEKTVEMFDEFAKGKVVKMDAMNGGGEMPGENFVENYITGELIRGEDNQLATTFEGHSLTQAYGDEGFVVFNWDTEKMVIHSCTGWETDYELADIQKAIADVSHLTYPKEVK